jgi:hypothetical protein
MDGEPLRKTAGLADSLDGKSRALTVADIAELLNISERQVYFNLVDISFATELFEGFEDGPF